ncbi:RidA family protein [Streptomyces sp. RS2]|uniref:RidA family protein n=1 Tax=Streptomyces sp. RS2 TaxID=1451205 RepID=UPI0021F90243|nr:RidA family protein [Streptomyces sp. RS2]MCW1100125.1 RidA family protein [Streptomyces sp. RS2]
MTPRTRPHTAVSTAAAPLPAAAYSQAITCGRLLHVAGQIPADPATGEISGGDVTAQTTLALANVRAVVEAAGGTFADIVMLRVYLTDRASFAAMNHAYEQYVARFADLSALPARTTVVVGLPLENMLVEIDAVAVLSNGVK